MTGAGNDFVVIDNRSRRIRDGSAAAKALCDRRWGVGADGLILLEKSRRADYRMMYYNADGSYGGMCGNGARCIALYAVKHGIAHRKHMIEALKYLHAVNVTPPDVTLWMKDPHDLRLGKTIKLDSTSQLLHFVDTGSPHAVICIEELPGQPRKLNAIDMCSLGRRIRYHPYFGPTGTNVNVVQRTGDNLLHIRTYERGVEDETLACGTGSVAAAIVGCHIWKLRRPVRVLPRSKVPLLVDFDEDTHKITNVTLTGPAKILFTGETKIPLSRS